jgi:hypothetical protein
MINIQWTTINNEKLLTVGFHDIECFKVFKVH